MATTTSKTRAGPQATEGALPNLAADFDFTPFLGLLKGNEWLVSILAHLSGFLGYGDGRYEFPPVEPDMQAEAVQKANNAANGNRTIELTNAPSAYKQAIDSGEQTITVTNKAGETVSLNRIEAINDPATGFKGAIYQNEETGHAIVFFGGMTDGEHQDKEALVQAGLKRQVNDQTGPAQ